MTKLPKKTFLNRNWCLSYFPARYKVAVEMSNFFLFLAFSFLIALPFWAQGSSTSYRSSPHQFGTTAIRSSSTLPPQGSNSYGPGNLDDGNLATAWVEGGKNDGIGEWVELRYDHPQKFSTLVIVNGYAKNDKAFSENNRVKAITLSAEGFSSMEFTLSDTKGEQQIRLPKPVTSSWVRLTVKSVYKGTKYSDTALSELRADLEEHNYQ